MLFYYIQLREHVPSSTSRSAQVERVTPAHQNRSYLICEATPKEDQADTNGSGELAEEDSKPVEQVDLNEAFQAMTEEMKLDWPEFFDWDPMMTVKQVCLGLLLFVALIGVSILCWEGLGYILNTISFLALK